MRYLVVVEKSEDSYGAYVPDLPGCIAAADSRDAVLRLIRQAVELHIEGLVAAGDPIPEPSSQAELIDIRAA